MRFTRAAKVAALPLLTMVLVVALIACQGPVGETGKSIKGDTGAGTPGKDAPPGLDAKALDAVVLNVNDTTAVMAMVDVSAGFTGGTAEGRTYRIVSATNLWPGLVYSLDGSTLKLSALANTALAIEDAVIWIEATDTDKANEVAHVNVRANDDVSIGLATSLIVGTQPVESRTLTDAEEANYHTATNITCAMKNTCEVTLTAEDMNIRDVLTWMVYVTATTGTTDIADANNDVVSASATNGAVQLDGVVTITGLKDGTAIVRVWAVDEGGVPVNRPDDPATTGEDEDESLPYPAADNGDAAVHTITVTVDAAPRLSADAVEDVKFTSLTGEAATKVIGTVFNDEADEELVLSSTVAHSSVASVDWAETGTDTRMTVPPAGVAIAVTGRNSELTGTAVTVKVTEAATDTDNSPSQYAEHSFTVTVDIS